MCTLAVYFQCSRTLPLVVAANRDEFYARPAVDPRVINRDPWIVAGQDLSAGGTWLGTNEHNLVVGILNRRNPDGPDPTRCSRGLLCLEALTFRSAEEVVDRLKRVDPVAYNWFNLLAADPRTAVVVSNAGDRMTTVRLRPGVHVLTNLAVNDPTCPRIAKSHRLFEAVPLVLDGDDAGPLLARLREILADHSTPLDPRRGDFPNTLCVHSPIYGTRSASVLIYFAEPGLMRYWHAAGPPCEVDFVEVPLPHRHATGHKT